MKVCEPCVYIMASARFGTLYTGVTSDLLARIVQHRAGTFGGFSAKYRTHRLVWFEMHEDMVAAIRREKTIKRWRRDWKCNLIERQNPAWNDLAPGFGLEPLLSAQVAGLDAGTGPA